MNENWRGHVKPPRAEQELTLDPANSNPKLLLGLFAQGLFERDIDQLEEGVEFRDLRSVGLPLIPCVYVGISHPLLDFISVILREQQETRWFLIPL